MYNVYCVNVYKCIVGSKISKQSIFGYRFLINSLNKDINIGFSQQKEITISSLLKICIDDFKLKFCLKWTIFRFLPFIQEFKGIRQWPKI